MNRFCIFACARRDPFKASVRFHNLRAFRFLETLKWAR